MEITLEKLAEYIGEHRGGDAIDLHGQNVYGDVLVRRDAMDKAMVRFGLGSARNANWMNKSSRVHWLGEVVGLHIEVKAVIVCRVGYNKQGWDRIQVPSPAKDGNFTHYKLDGYMPANVHIRGKGRDKLAWSVYRAMVTIIEEERAKYAR